MQSDYAKVLLVGQYFDKEPGYGITLTNLFKQWDIERIAATAENITNPDFSICKNYYNLGASEIKRNFPFNLRSSKQKVQSGILLEKSKKNPRMMHGIKESQFKKFYEYLISITGLRHHKHRYEISADFLAWVKEFSPDFIYSQLSTLELILFVTELHEKTQIPVAIHIMDDWPSTVGKKGILQSYWHKKINNSFRTLLSKSSVFMSISDAMSKEYQARYGYKFIPFHNPIDIDFWSSHQKNNYDLNKMPRILYAGRIGIGIQKSLKEVANAVKAVNEELGIGVKFIIKTNEKPTWTDEFSCVEIQEMESHNKMPAVFANADILVLSLDFAADSIRFTKYSMPTKASEYMMSGTPILLYASSKTAVTNHALKYKWAYVVSEQKNELLKKALIDLCKKKELRIQLGSTAKDFAQRKYDGDEVRAKFRKAFISHRVK